MCYSTAVYCMTMLRKSKFKVAHLFFFLHCFSFLECLYCYLSHPYSPHPSFLTLPFCRTLPSSFFLSILLSFLPSLSPSFLPTPLPYLFPSSSFLPPILPSFIQNLACLTVHAFKQLKAYEMTSSCGLLRHSALGLAFLRVLLRNITVFQKRNIDILLKRLNVAYVRASLLFCTSILFIIDFPKIFIFIFDEYHRQYVVIQTSFSSILLFTLISSK